MDMYLLIQGAMTEDERKTFLANFTRANPSWDGAHVADVLASLHDGDMYCGEVDELYMAHKRQWTYLTGTAAIAVQVVHGKMEWNLIHELLGRLHIADVMGKRDILRG